MVDLPVRRLPSLNGIKAFEAAARTGSFAAAAAELHVSAAAISRLVHLLEARLGIALFDRRANRLVATAAGRAYQAGLTPLLDALAALTEQVAAPAGPRALTIGVGPTFAIRWLIPRLAGFRRLEPEIEVRFATGGRAVPFADGWTCGIALGDGTWPGLACEPLFAADLLPVCAPALAAALRDPRDLVGTSLLRVGHAPEDWPLWLEAAGLGGLAARGPEFENYGQALQAAADGVGPSGRPLRAQRAEGAPLVPAVSPGRAGRPHLRRLPVVADGRSPRAGPGDPVILAVPSRRFYNRPVLRRTKTAALRPGTLERRSMEQVSPRLDNLVGFYLEDLHVGMSARIARTVTEADILMFAGVSGDTNPLHLNEVYAQGTMFRGRIAHGILTASLISAVFGTLLPGPGAVYVTQNLRFKAPVRAGDTVDTRVTVAEITPGKNRVVMQAVCKVGDRVVVDGDAVLMVPARPA